MAHAMFLVVTRCYGKSAGFLMLQAHVQEHVSIFSRDQVAAFFQNAQQQALQAGEAVPNIDPAVIESAVAQQVGEIMKEIMPMIQPPQQQDPLIGIRQQGA